MRAALFDVDGTLLDSNDFHVEAWSQAFADFGIDVPVSRLRQQMGNGGDRLVKALCTPQQAARLSRPLIERHVEILGVGDLLDAGASAGFRDIADLLAKYDAFAGAKERAA